MRGDRPVVCVVWICILRFTPHARGSTCQDYRYPPPPRVYPACAGIDRNSACPLPPRSGFPRMRGDRPSLTNGERLTKTFTPHARGSTLLCLLRTLRRIVYPACAGIDPFLSLFFTLSLFLPRMRGDRPLWYNGIEQRNRFTPHARGSTQ